TSGARASRPCGTRRGLDGASGAVFDWGVSRAFWRGHDEYKHGVGLRDGARSGDGTHWIGLAANDCFRKNRPGDVEVTLLGPGAAFESKWIRLVDLKGELFSYPETDEQYPTQWADQRTVLMQLMANPDPRLQAVLGDPSNLGLLKRLIGLDELVIP